MVKLLLSQMRELMQAARDNYGVDPVVFLAIYFAAVPFFYYSLFRRRGPTHSAAVHIALRLR